MMDRKECLKAVARHVSDADIVLPVYSTAIDWIDNRPTPLNYLSHGAMGLASSHALGLALGRPDRRVIVLDGDGSLLMNLGTLVTTAEAAPKNLYHFVMENGTNEPGHMAGQGLLLRFRTRHTGCHSKQRLEKLPATVGQEFLHTGKHTETRVRSI